jgi:hypothetical protein
MDGGAGTSDGLENRIIPRKQPWLPLRQNQRALAGNIVVLPGINQNVAHEC